MIQVLNGEEPEQKVELATLDFPNVTAIPSGNTAILSWEPVERAVEYQIFEYDEETGLLHMLNRTEATSIVMTDLKSGVTYRYIVQPISYVEIADNVSPENSISVICGKQSDGISIAGQAIMKGVLAGVGICIAIVFVWRKRH